MMRCSDCDIELTDGNRFDDCPARLDDPQSHMHESRCTCRKVFRLGAYVGIERSPRCAIHSQNLGCPPGAREDERTRKRR